MDFDRVIDRRGTNCAKWDEMDEKYGRKDLIHLGVADMDFRPPEPIREALLSVVRDGVWGYTNPSEEFFGSISGWLSKQNGREVPVDWLLFCPRINVGAGVLVEAFSSPGDAVMMHSPCYMPLFQAAKKNGREVIVSPLKEEGGRFVMDLEDMERRVTGRTRLLFLCSPHNPTGRIWSEEELERAAEFCRRHDLILVSDEIHCDIHKAGQKFRSALQFRELLKDRLIVLNAPTKTFNMPGVIVSYMVIPDSGLRERVAAVIDRMGMHNPTVFAVPAVTAGYTLCDGWLEELNRYIDGNESFFREFMREHMPLFRITPREGTYLLWIDCRSLRLTDEELERWFVEKARVAVYPGNTFGRDGAGYIRLNLGTSRKTLEEALGRMRQAYEALKARNEL